MSTEDQVDRALDLLRTKIRRQGFTQLKIQEELNWGRSYISQIMNRQKSLRLDQALMILEVIGVHPWDFFREVFEESRSSEGGPHGDEAPSEISPPSSGTSVEAQESQAPALAAPSDRNLEQEALALLDRLTSPEHLLRRTALARAAFHPEEAEEIRRSVDHVGSLAQGMAELLIEKDLLSLDELSEASQSALKRRRKEDSD